MKHGDQVNTPKGMGIFFNIKEEDASKAYVVLKDPTEDKIYVPLVEGKQPVWDCFPCDVFDVTDITVTKTFEERQREAHEAALKRQAERDALLKQKMQEQMQRQGYHQEAQQAQKEAHEQQQQTTESNDTNV